MIIRALSDGLYTMVLYHPIWTNRSRPRAAGSDRPTFGRLVTQRLPSSAGLGIVLESMMEGNRLRGWFTWSQVEQLMLWRDTAAKLTLNYDSEIRFVTVPLDGIQLEPVVQYSKTPAAEDICTGTLTLFEV